MKEGDIVRWYFPENGSYHCRSQIAIMRNGFMCDTYWGIYAGGGFRFLPSDIGETIAIDESLGNIADLVNAAPWQSDYYADADIVDLRHSNNTSAANFYLRKGALRSKDKMIESAHREIKNATVDISAAADRLRRAYAAIAQIETADDLMGIYL